MLYIKDDSALTGTAVQQGAIVATGTIRVFRALGAHNDTGATVTLKAYLVAEGGSADDALNLTIERAVPTGKTDECKELIGRGLNAGGKLMVLGLNMTFGYTAIDTIIS